MTEHEDMEKAVDAARGVVPVSADELRVLPGRLMDNPVDTFRAMCELSVGELRELWRALSQCAANAYHCIKQAKQGDKRGD